MTTKLAINGFGRIGRNILRAFFEEYSKGDLEIVAINDLAPLETNVHLLKYDTVHGRFSKSVAMGDGEMIVDGSAIKVMSERDPTQIGWGDMGVDIVLECTGVFRDKEAAMQHIEGGAKKVIVSAPAKGVDRTVVYGVNHDQLSADDLVISNASCTTNCLAPMAKVLNDAIGIEHGFMTTIHSYTSDQRIVDTFHSDPFRARAAAQNLIPTSTGAAAAVGLVLPELNGKLDGVAIRVPTPNVSLVDLKFTASKATTVEEVNSAIAAAAAGDMAGVLGSNSEPLVSSDFNHNPNSSTFDAGATKVMDGTFVRVMSWYDNEWGFSCRMLDTSSAFAQVMAASPGKSEAPAMKMAS